MVLDKRKIRKDLLKKREALDENTVHCFSSLIMDQLKNTEFFQLANTIGIYLSYHNEVETWSLIKEVIHEKKICVPVVNQDRTMQFVLLDSFENLEKNKYGIDEPKKHHLIDKEQIELMIIPVVGYNDQGSRVGYGGGYYDKYLKHFHGKKIGIAYSFQHTNDFAVQEHDIALDMIITEKKIITFKPG